jgi:AAA+ ATPase superfamily predicted ATPase
MNPFNYGTIVKGADFYDREEECEHIVKTLSGGNNLVLYAPRRFGKTSLVFKAIEQLEGEGFLCIYFDFMPVYSPESFVRLYTKALSAKQSNLEKFAQTFAGIVKSIRPVLSFDASGNLEFSINMANATIDETVISQLLDVPEKMGVAGKRKIVFFDEFQEVERLSGIRFESLLRSKIQSQSSTHYLFFGSKTHMLKDLFNDKKRAFYNAASQMTMGALPQKDTIDYLQKKFAGSAITLQPEIAEYIISAAADVPFYIQFLSAEIWQYMVNSHAVVTQQIVDDCIARVLSFKNDYYIELFDRQSQSKKQLLLALTISGESIFSTAYIREHCLPNAATLQRATQDLLKDGTIEKANGVYFITDPFFKLFLNTM